MENRFETIIKLMIELGQIGREALADWETQFEALSTEDQMQFQEGFSWMVDGAENAGIDLIES